MQQSSELVFNIWFIIDIATQTSSYCFIKSYCLAGSDEEKTNFLNSLAETDFNTTESFKYAKGQKIIFNNNGLDDAILRQNINSFFDNNIDLFLNELESKLPPIVKYQGDNFTKNEIIKQTFPSEPLFCMTYLMENEYGEMKPFTTEQNKSWAESEYRRIDLKARSNQI